MNIININEIAKEMTREEFLNCIDKDGFLTLSSLIPIIECPEDIELKNYYDTDLCDSDMCKFCWKEAIKNVKFKGEDNMEENNRLLKFECVKDYYMKNGDKAFTKGNTYEVSTINFLYDDISKYPHYMMNSEIDNLSLYFKPVEKANRITEKEINNTDTKSQLYYGDEILKMIREGKIKGKQEFYIYRNGKKIENEIAKWDGIYLYGNNGSLEMLDILVYQFKIIEKKYFDLEGAMSMAGIEGLKLKHKDWDNFVPKSDIMPNLVLLIKENKLDVNDICKKVWEVEE